MSSLVFVLQVGGLCGAGASENRCMMGVQRSIRTAACVPGPVGLDRF